MVGVEVSCTFDELLKLRLELQAKGYKYGVEEDFSFVAQKDARACVTHRILFDEKVIEKKRVQRILVEHLI